MKQLDFFATQPDPSGEAPQPVVYRADPVKVRAKLLAVLAEAKAASEVPWPYEDFRYHQTVFPQMCNWLPEEEAAQLRLEFAAEVKRLLAA